MAAACSRVLRSAVLFMAAPAGLQSVLLLKCARRKRFCTAARMQKAGRNCCSIRRCPVASSPCLRSMTHTPVSTAASAACSFCSSIDAGAPVAVMVRQGGGSRPGGVQAAVLSGCARGGTSSAGAAAVALCTITLQAAEQVPFNLAW